MDDNALGVSYKGFTAWSSFSFYGGPAFLQAVHYSASDGALS